MLLKHVELGISSRFGPLWEYSDLNSIVPTPWDFVLRFMLTFSGATWR